MTMVNNPYEYAVQLLPEAESVLVAAYGEGHGLTICERKRSRDHGNKAKPNRVYVRLNDQTMERVKELMSRMHFATVQDFAEAAILQMIDKYGVGL